MAILEMLFVLLWVTVASLLLIRLLIANVLLSIARHSSACGPDSIHVACARMARRLGIETPAVLINHRFRTPCVTGWLRPAILLPEEATPHEGILLHELAHVVRRDCLWHLLGRIFAALLWFQPLASVLVRQMERSAEDACDDWVVAQGSDRAGYAHRLVELAEKSQARWSATAAGVGVIAIRSSVGRRVVRLLDISHEPQTKIARRLRVALILSPVVAALGAGRLIASFAAPAQAASGEPAPSHVTYAGRVLLPDGKPASGADVFLGKWAPDEEKVLASAKCDAQGKFSFPNAPESSADARPDLQAYLPGFAVVTHWPERGDRNEMRLTAPTKITLTFVDPAGKPVQGLHVVPSQLASARPIGSDVSDAWSMRLPTMLRERLGGNTAPDGTVTFKDLPRDWILRVEFSDERFALPGLGEQIRLAAQPVTPPMTVRLKAGATITGSVVYGTTGKPATGVRVYAQATDRNIGVGGATAVTDQNGEFRMTQMLGGEFNVMLGLQGQMDRDWTAFAREGLRVEPGQVIEGIDLKLIKGALVRGKVTKADTGEPIANAEVSAHSPAHPQSSASIQGTKAGPDGTYTLRVPPGKQQVYLQGGALAEPYRQFRQELHDIDVADGQTVTLDFAVPRRPGKPVEGVVLDADGKPAPNVIVTAHEANTSPFDSISRQTDSHGRFKFEVLNVGTDLTARDATRATTKPVNVDGGEVDVTLRLFPRAAANLSGLVTDISGKPIAGARVKLFEDQGQFGRGSGAAIRTDANGRYLLSNLYSDTQYSVAAEADGYGESQMKIPTDRPKGDLPPLKLAKADAMIVGTVMDSNRKPVKGIPVTLSGNMFPKTMTSDEQGHFSFAAVPGQRLIVSVRLSDSRPGPTVMVRGGQDEIKLVMPP